MNILLINHYAGSPNMGMEFRPYYLAHEWAKMGHSVTVLAATYSHLRQRQPKVSRSWQEQELEPNLRYVWLKTPRYASPIRRILNIFTFVLRVHFAARRIAKHWKPDIVIASSTYPFDIYPARRITRRAGARLIYEVHDLWPLTPMVVGGYSPRHPFIWLMQRAENYAYRHVDHVISLLWNSEPHMREHGLAPGKFTCIPNGFTPSEWETSSAEPLPELHRTLLGKLRAARRFIVGFTGGYTLSAGVYTLLKAAASLREDPSIALVFMGDGLAKSEMEAYVSEHGLTNVHILPPIPKRAVPTVLPSFDLAYMGSLHSVLDSYGTSMNKEIDYMMGSLPIVSSVDEPNARLEREGYGLRVEAENAPALAEAIRRLASMSPEDRQAMGRKGREYALANLAYPTLAQRMLEAMQQ